MIPETSQNIFDSPVIIQYLESIADHKISPSAADPNYFATLTVHALGDGILDAGVLLVYENRRVSAL